MLDVLDIFSGIGGFPCQDISTAGRKAGIDGEKSGLWREYDRLVREIRPRFVVVENVPGVPGGNIGPWLGRILGDLAEIGYDAEWHCIPAAAVGAHHRRDRVFIIADTLRVRLENRIPFGFRGRKEAKKNPLQAVAGCGLPRWPDPPEVGCLVHGLPRKLAGWRKAAITALGNSVVPQVATLIGLAILESLECA